MNWSTSNRKERLPKNWFSLRRTILARDRYICQLGYVGCTTEASEVDHRERGDDHSPDNLQAACSSCHAKKSSSEGGRAAASANRRRKQQRLRPTERHPGRR